MMKNIKHITAYVLGQLSEEDRIAFEAELQRDEDLQLALARFKTLLSDIGVYGKQELRAKIEAVERELEQEGFFLTEAEIDAYLKEEATPELQTLIEQRQQRDAVFAKQLAMKKELIAGIETFGAQVFLAQIQQTDQMLAQEGFFEQSKNEIAKTKTAKVVAFSWRKAVSIAAAISGLVLSIWAVSYMLYSGGILDDHFVAHQNELSSYLEETGFVETDGLVQLELGMQQYEQQYYKAAQTTFQNYINQTASDDFYLPFARFYLAQTHLAQSNTIAAIPILEDLSKNTDFELQEDAQWYLVLAYLDNERFDVAEDLLNELRNSEKYSEQATVLQKKYLK